MDSKEPRHRQQPRIVRSVHGAKRGPDDTGARQEHHAQGN